MEPLARCLLPLSTVMRQVPASPRPPSFIIVASLVTVFLLGLAMVGTYSTVAMAAETGCSADCDSTALVGLAGSTLSLLAKEALGVLKIGTGTLATVTLAMAKNAGGIGLWVYAVYWAMMSHLALVAAGVLLLAVVYARKVHRT